VPDRTGAASLEQRIARLEQIVAGLEREELELDEALKLFEEGIGHLRDVRGLLQAAELRVERLLQDADGSLSTEALPEE
jgi:exodeoxyribonuclease VII small subunit